MRAVLIFAAWCLVLSGRALPSERLAHDLQAAQINPISATAKLAVRRAGADAPDARVLVAMPPAQLAIPVPPRSALPTLFSSTVANRGVSVSSLRARGPPIA